MTADVVTFRPRARLRKVPKPSPIFFDFLGVVGGIMLVVYCEPGTEETGPYSVLLRDPVKDTPIITFTKPEDQSTAEYLEGIRHWLSAIMRTLWVADENVQYLPSQLANNPTPA